MTGTGGVMGTGGMTGTGGMMAGTGGMMGTGGMTGTGGMMGTGGMTGTGGMVAVDPNDMFSAARQVCVDYINMYRATLGVAPLKRGTAAQETCSDMGAKKDADANAPHSSAGDCAGLGAQNTCPGWRIGGFSGNATLEDALRSCLDAMWDEGEPPIPRDDCIRDYQGCFLPHGHWINMSDERSGTVACGFYMMPDGRFWMNQNFGR
jgi:hypothetical protein